MKRNVNIGGVGMVPFAKPGKSEHYYDMGGKAIAAALKDAGVTYDQVQQAYAGYIYGDSTCGQRTIYGAGLTGIPIVNVNNNCSSGSTALWMARQVVESGVAECVLAVGFEEMRPGALRSNWDDRPMPMSEHIKVLDRTYGYREGEPNALQFFGAAGQEYIKQYGMAPETFGLISVKARKHAANNPYSVFRDQVTHEQVMDSPPLYGYLTRLQACPPTCGAAAAIVYSDDFAKANGLTPQVRIKAQALTTDYPSTFTEDNMMKVVGYDLSKAAAQQVYDESGVDPKDIRVAEMHDCFTVNEVLCYEALGLVDEGGSEQFILDGDNTYGGRVVTNPSGGLLSKGHPIGATGLAQCAELTWQLRGQADKRQVEGVNLALQHNLGLGGAAVVTLYEKVA